MMKRMGRAGLGGAIALVLLAAAEARAEEVEATDTPPAQTLPDNEPPPPLLLGDEPPPPPRKKAPSGPPPARVGFQMDFRTGARFPVGLASGEPGDELSARYRWQVPFTVGLGVKLSPHLYLGGYLGAAFGSEGSDARTRRACRNGDGCQTTAMELGAQISYFFSPAARWSPWVSYGLGYEQGSQSLDTDSGQYLGHTEETTAEGFTFAKLMVGIDRRHKVGFGPYAEAAIGQYYSTRTLLGDHSAERDIDQTAVHAWLTLGARLVLAP